MEGREPYHMFRLPPVDGNTFPHTGWKAARSDGTLSQKKELQSDKNMKRYFMISRKESTPKEGEDRLRVTPVEGQTLDGRPVDTSLHVSCSRKKRSSYPEGTVFSCLGFTDKGTHYAADITFSAVVTPDGTVLNEPAYQEYRKLLSSTGACEVIYTDLFGEVTSMEMKMPAKKASPAPKPAETKAARKPKVSMEGRTLDVIRSSPAYSVPSIAECGFWIAKDKWEIICRNIMKVKNTLITGPTGTGKTQFVEMACRRLGLAFHWYDMGITKDPISTLIGTHRIVDGRSVFDWADFAQRIQEPGVILLDELSRAVPMALNILFPCLDGRRTLRAEMAGGSDMREIKVHPQCVFIATANIGDEYTGVVDEIDAALRNRFFQIEMSPLPKDQEIQLLRAKHGIGDADAKNIVTVAANIRSMRAKDEITTTVSTRDTLECAELIEDGYSIREALELKLLPLFCGTDTEGERSVVKKVIMSY